MRKKSDRTDLKTFEEAERFFSENKQAIGDYAGKTGITFEAGDKWSIDFLKGRGTFDPMFFYKNGFSAAESMWAVCHEIEHIRDWARDPEAYANIYRRTGKGRRRLMELPLKKSKTLPISIRRSGIISNLFE